jgi:hypothetical protein
MHCLVNKSFSFLFFLKNLRTFFIIVVLGGVTLWHLQKFLQCVKCITLEFGEGVGGGKEDPTISGIVSTGVIFAFTHMCTQFLHYHHHF